MIKYPKKLDTIFSKLKIHHITPIIIGGYVRDFFLNINSKDIDIELYGINSLEKVITILEEFGSVNLVGKSFGVCKLNLDGLELDFSLPRKDSKISSGHKGFKIETDGFLSFKEAAKRRDFTINAIGYNPISKKILDPFDAQKDLKNHILKAVDLEKFSEDPLRVLRGVVFCARFEMKMDNQLKKLCSSMIEQKMLDELPRDRIFKEIKKIITKAKKPSVGFKLLWKLSQKQLPNLKEDDFEEFLKLTDKITTIKLTQKELNKLTNIILTILDNSTCQKELEKELISITNPTSLLQGRDLIELGLKPSKRFSTILKKAYEAQLNGEFKDIKNAKIYLKNLLSQDSHFSF